MSRAEYARMRGKARATVTERVKQGAIKLTEDRKVNVAQADAATGWGEPQEEPASETETSSRDANTWDHRERKERFLADKRELEVRELAGDLGRVDEMEKAGFDAARIARDAFLRMPLQMSQTLAPEMPPQQVENILTEAVIAILEEGLERGRSGGIVAAAAAEPLQWELPGLGDARARYLAGCAAGWKPDPRGYVWEWADECRVLTSTDSNEAGPWKTSRTPYLREIMEAISPQSDYVETVVMKGGQVGATQGIGVNHIGFVIDRAPGPYIVIQPTIDLAKHHSTQRIGPMLESAPTLEGKVGAVKTRDGKNTILVKEFPGGLLAMIGANAPAPLRSRTARYMHIDEEDAYPRDVGGSLSEAGEGDPIYNARVRARSYGHRRRIVRTSTPVNEETSRIELGFLEGDQRYYLVPCTECSAMQPLVWGGKDHDYGVKWDPEKPSDAYYVCPFCHGAIEHGSKDLLLANGEWWTIEEAKAHSDFLAQLCEEASGVTKRKKRPRRRKAVASFHLSALYSPLGWYSWGDAAEEWLQVAYDPLGRRSFINATLGQTYKIATEVPSDERLMDCREPLPAEERYGKARRLVPRGAAWLTCGVDVQADRVELQVIAWGPGMECWVIEYSVIFGDPTAEPIWGEVARFLYRPRHMERGGVDWIRSTCIDAGYASQEVYAFVGSRTAYRTPEGGNAFTWAIQGKAGTRQVWPSKPSKSKLENVPVYLIGVDPCKDWIYQRCQARIASKVKGETNGPGFVHFHDELDETYFRQLTSEQRRTHASKTGHQVAVYEMRPGHVRNEQLDTFVYAYAACTALTNHPLNRDLEHEAKVIADRIFDPNELGVELELVTPVPKRTVYPNPGTAPAPQRRRARGPREWRQPWRR